MEGGQLWKIRMPLPLPDKGKDVPQSVSDIAVGMRKQFSAGERWWEAVAPPPMEIDPELRKAFDGFAIANPQPQDTHGLFQGVVQSTREQVAPDDPAEYPADG